MLSSNSGRVVPSKVNIHYQGSEPLPLCPQNLYARVLTLASAVKSIKKKDLVEIKSMNNPPQAVKTALEAICLLLGEASNDWKTMRSVIVKDNFISNIVALNTEDIG